MQSTLRIERVMRSNSRMFALFEYSKLITPLENYISIRSLQDDERYDTVLPIPETQAKVQISVDSILSVAVSDNTRIICLEKAKLTLQQQQQNVSQELQVARYEDGQRRCIRLQARGTKLVAKLVLGNFLLYGIESSDKEFIELFLIDCNELKIKAAGYLGDRVKDIQLINWGDAVGISVLVGSELKIFQCVEHQPAQSPPFGFASNRSYHVLEDTCQHRYVNNQYMVTNQPTSLTVYKDYHKIQQIQLSEPISAVETNSFGFFVCTPHRLRYFRQRRQLFQQEVNLDIAGIDVCSCMVVSPSDTLLVLEAENGSMVSIWIDYQQGNETMKNECLSVKMERPPRKELVAMAASPSTSHLATIEKSPYCLSVHDLESRQVVTYQLVSDDESAVTDCCFHPTIPILAVAYKAVVKFYCLLYSEIKEIRQLALVRVRRLFFSNCGNFFGCVTGKGKGVKISLFETRNYTPVDTLWVGEQPINIFWSNYDNIIYIVAEHALLYWSVEDFFKNRKELTDGVNEARVGGFCDRHNKSVVEILEQAMLRIQSDGTVEKLRSAANLTQVVPFATGYVLACSNGTILTGPHLEVGAVSHLKINLFRKGVRLYQCRNKILCRSSDDQLIIMSERDTASHASIEHDIILADRRLITENITQLRNHERDMKKLQEKYEQNIAEIRRDFALQQSVSETKFKEELVAAGQKQQHEKEQKHLLEKFINDNSEVYERQQFQAVAELEKLYERKLVLTTNRLLTSEEIDIRNQVSAEKNLKELSAVHDTDIRRIRDTYFDQVKKIGEGQLKQKDGQIKLHKEYQQKIRQIEEEYETLLRDIQLDCDTRIREEKRMNVVWESRFTTSQSEKANLEQSIRVLKTQNEYLLSQQARKDNANQLMERKVELAKKDGLELHNVIKGLEERLAEYDYKVKDLEKAKEILTFRVLETRNLLAPKQKQLSDFQSQFETLQQEFQKTLHQSQENLQKAERLKRDLDICKKDLASSKSREKALTNKFDVLVNKIYDGVNHSVAEMWGRCLMKLYEEYCQDLKHQDSLKNRSKNTVQELNRMRQHLEDCLSQVITSNEKIQQRKAQEFTKKTQENAELLTDINDLRRQLKDMKGVLDQKNNEIERLKAQRLQSQLADQRRLKTEGFEDRRRSKLSETDGRNTFYRNEQHDSTNGFSKIMGSRHSKRTPSAQKTTVRRGNNFNRSFRVDMELNRRFQQEQQLKEARRQLQLQQQLIIELKTRHQ